MSKKVWGAGKIWKVQPYVLEAGASYEVIRRVDTRPGPAWARRSSWEAALGSFLLLGLLRDLFPFLGQLREAVTPLPALLIFHQS